VSRSLTGEWGVWGVYESTQESESNLTRADLHDSVVSARRAYGEYSALNITEEQTDEQMMAMLHSNRSSASIVHSTATTAADAELMRTLRSGSTLSADVKAQIKADDDLLMSRMKQRLDHEADRVESQAAGYVHTIQGNQTEIELARAQATEKARGGKKEVVPIPDQVGAEGGGWVETDEGMVVAESPPPWTPASPLTPPSTPSPPLPAEPAVRSSRRAVAKLVKTGLQKGLEEGEAVEKQVVEVAKKVKARLDKPNGKTLDRMEAEAWAEARQELLVEAEAAQAEMEAEQAQAGAEAEAEVVELQARVEKLKARQTALETGIYTYTRM